MATEMHLRMVTPDRILVDRDVRSVTFMGVDGSYGILPHHAPLMTAIAHAGAVRVTELDGTRTSMFASDGFAQMANNVLTIVAQSGEPVQEIDLERVKRAEQKAREKLAGLDKLSQEYLQAEASLQRAMMRELLARRSGSD
jgi:F-type H+-transporting ATPase subunit epsilon